MAHHAVVECAISSLRIVCRDACIDPKGGRRSFIHKPLLKADLRVSCKTFLEDFRDVAAECCALVLLPLSLRAFGLFSMPACGTLFGVSLGDRLEFGRVTACWLDLDIRRGELLRVDI